MAKYLLKGVKNHVLKKGSEYVTSEFGYRKDPVTGKKSSFHGGVDLISKAVKNVTTDHIIAFASGKITIAKKSVTGVSYHTNTGGNFIEIDHGNGYATRYLHLKFNSTLVHVNEKVNKGQPIAYMNSTGYSTGNHLHFEVRYKGERLDPIPFLLGTKSISPKPKPVVDVAIAGVKVGDVVSFTGTKQYAKPADSVGKACKFGKAKVVQLSPLSPHPFKLKAVLGGGSNVNGWVDAKYINSAPYFYTVLKGDNLSIIARKFGTNVTNLVKLNSLKDPNFLSIGQVLKLR